MRKWVFVLGIVCCSLLFFVAGTLIGYSVSQKKVHESIVSNEKSTRKPSKNINPIIGRIVQHQISRFNTKTRIPTPKAIIQARRYKSIIIGG